MSIKYKFINKIMENKPFYEIPNEYDPSLAKFHNYSVAPMMEITNSHFRTFARLLTKKAVLYSEMIHCDTILNNPNPYRFLHFKPVENPIVLQLGGCHPQNLAKAAAMGQEYGYAEINLNTGCPSPRVTSGSFGACLMKEPKLVAECLRAMEEAVDVPVTVKCRLGVDEYDSYEFLTSYVDTILEETTVNHFVIHARKAYLKGLSPKENRTIPPLMPERVYQLAQDYPKINFTLNGGIKTLDQVEEFLKGGEIKGCMIGRAAYDDIWHLADIDRRIYGVDNPGFSRKEALLLYADYGEKEMIKEPKLNYNTLVKPLLSLFVGEKGTSFFRRFLSDHSNYNRNGKSFIKLMDDFVEEFEKINSLTLNANFKGPQEEKGKDEEIK